MRVIRLKRTALVGASGLLVLAGAVGLARPASAEDCVRANPTVGVTSPLHQYGAPGSSAVYTMDVTNSDSAGCLTSDFTFTPFIPYDWSASVTPDLPVTLAPQETVSVSLNYTVAETAPGDLYDLPVFTMQHYNSEVPTEDVVVPTYFTFKVLAEPGPTPPPLPTPDLTAPVVDITSPANGAVVARNSTVFITANASDNVGVTSVVYSVDGQVICSGSTTQVCEWQTPRRKGNYQVTVAARDAAGNSGTDSATIVVK